MPSRTAPTLPPQALPPDKRKKELPPPFEDMLPSGLVVKWRTPDVFKMITFDGVVPDPLTASVITLLEEEKATRPETDPRKYQYSAQAIKGMYSLAAAMLVEPRLDASSEYGDGNGTLGRSEVGYLDVTQLYWLFRLGRRQPTQGASDSSVSIGSALAAPDSGGV